MRVKKVIKNVKIGLLLAKYEGKVSDKKNVKIGLLLAKYEGKVYMYYLERFLLLLYSQLYQTDDHQLSTQP